MVCFRYTRWTERLTTSSIENPALASAYVISVIDETVRGNEAVTSQCVQLQYFPTRSDKLHRDRREQTRQPASPCNIATTSKSV
jgi:hypothetical protein